MPGKIDLEGPATTTPHEEPEMTTTQPQAKLSTSTTDRYRSADCTHANSHITREAALACGGKDAKLTTVPRYWGTVDGKRCECRYGHKTQATALACVGGKPATAAKAAAPAAPAKTAAAKATPKPAAPKVRALRSVAEGAGSRA
jgi:hypothetical protein